MLFVQRRAGHGCIQHELVKNRIVADGVIDDRIHVLGRMVFQADDRGTQNADAMRLQTIHDCTRIGSPKLVVGAFFAFQSHPDPADAQPHELVHRVRLQDRGRAEHVQGPAFIVFLHQFE